ncbi:MAG: Ig-like domain repeat protein, partial [Acidobacteria bacterium]|nr:Ig-like domain repeat protein [Acidobacteriota bacterium]
MRYGWTSIGRAAGRTGRARLLTLGLLLTTAFVQNGAVQGTWTAKAAMPTPRQFPAAGVVDGRLYVASGNDNQWHGAWFRVATLEIYDPVLDSWSTGASIPIPLYAAGSGAIGNKLYVAGGQPWPQVSGENINIKKLQIYDATTNQWSEGVSMPAGVGGMASAVYDGKLYVAGGRNASNSANIANLYIYDSSTQTWRAGASMSTARQGAGAAFLDGRMYVVGGHNGSVLATVEAYDPSAGPLGSDGLLLGAWTTKAPLQTARWGVTAAVVDGTLYAVGGKDASANLAVVEVYDPTAGPLGSDGLPIGAWTVVDPMPAAHFMAAADVIDDVLYVAGGQTTGDAFTGANHAFAPVPADTSPPTLALPNLVTAEATSADGAIVTYVASATDDVDGPVTLECQTDATPPVAVQSGSLFPLGTTVVNCSATDAAGNSAEGSFEVRVEDTTAPSFSGVPSDITTPATSLGGAAVSYATPTASDVVDGTVPVSCTPASESTFAIGTITVTCTATDAATNSASTTFTVTVTKLNQTITFGALADKVFGDPDFAVSATASSGLAVSFSAAGECTVSGASAHVTAAGTCTITASQAGDSHYNAAPNVSQSFAIAEPALNFVAAVPVPSDTRLIAANSVTHRAYVAVGSGFTSSTFKVSVIEGTSDVADIPVSAGSTGPTWVAVNEATNRIYVNHTGANFATAINGASNSVIGTFSTGQYPEGIVTNPLTNRLYVANTNSGNVQVFNTANDANSVVATIAIPGSGAGITNLYLAIIPGANRLFVTAPGLKRVFVVDTTSNSVVTSVATPFSSYFIAAHPVTNELYLTLSGDPHVLVLDGSTGAEIASIPVSGPAQGLGVNARSNRIYVTTTGADASKVTVIDGATHSVVGTSTDLGSPLDKIAFDKSYGRVYVTTTSRTVALLDDPETPPDSTPPVISDVPADIMVPATSSSGAAVSYTAPTAVDDVDGTVPVVCTPASGSVFGIGTTELTCTATDAAANSASATFDVTVTKLSQTIAFGALADRTYGDADFTIGATGSSGLPVSFTAAGSCTVTGSTVHLTAAGSCTITASQSGNATYEAAPDVSQTLSIAKATLTVTASDASRVYGAPNPAFAASYGGFVNGDTLETSGVTGSPSFTTTATSTSAVASYAIAPGIGSLAASNYTFTFVNGTLTVTKASTTVVVASSVNPSTYSDSVTFAATVLPVAPGSGIPSGNVQFTENGIDLGGPVGLSPAGIATFTTSTLPAGSHVIEAAYLGDSNFHGSTSGQITQTVNTAATLTSLTANVNPSTFGQPVTLTATVTRFMCLPSPSGLITWLRGEGNAADSEGGNNGTLVNGAMFTQGIVGQAFSFNGTSAVDLASAPAVSSTGSWTYDLWVKVTSSTNGSYFVDRTAETLGLASLTQDSGRFAFQVRYDDGSGLTNILGSPVETGVWTHVAMVRDREAALFRLYMNGLQVASAPDNGKALTPAAPKLGHHDLSNLGGFTGSIDEFRITSRALSAAEVQSIADAGGAGTCVGEEGGGGPVAEGTVVFKDGDTVLTDPLSLDAAGQASAELLGLDAGDHTIAVEYSGSSNFNGSSGSSTHTVNKAAAAVVVNGFTGVYDGAAHGASGTATGVNGEDLSALLDLGASFTDVPGGTAQWTFAGNTNYAPGSGDATITIVQANQTVAFGALANKTYGDSDFSTNATASSGLPVNVAAAGNCTVTGSTVHITGAGSCTITASQAGNLNYSAAPDVSQGFAIAKAPTTATLTSSQNPSAFGQPVTFTAIVSASNPFAGTPTGTVQFAVDGANLGGAVTLVDGGGESAPTATLSAGTHVVTVTYGGDDNFASAMLTGTAAFTFTGSMSLTRYWHTATRVHNGMVLIAGAYDADTGAISSTHATAELYDPAASLFLSTGHLSTPRYSHTATLLNDGTVLLAGGNGEGLEVLSGAEIYDPATGQFLPTGGLSVPRVFHTSTLLNDGRVLIVGGTDVSDGSQILSSAEIYDPTTGTFTTTTGDLATARYAHSATLLSDGRVLITGGYGGTSLASAELYDPATDQFSPTGGLTVGRLVHTATRLNDGTVLVVGGFSHSSLYLSSAEIYDPVSGEFSATGSLGEPRIAHTATLLNDGSVLIAGGGPAPLDTAELYDPAAGQFLATAGLSSARAVHTATLLTDGSVLIAGGYGLAALSTAERYMPAAAGALLHLVEQADQTIAFDSLDSKTYGDADFMVGASASSGLPVTFSAGGDCAIAGVTVHLTGAGSCTITASQPGNENFRAAPDISHTLSIEQAAASITVNGFAGVYDGAAHGATGTATGVNGEDLSAPLDLGASFTDVPGGTAHWTFAGNTNYAPASGDATITITQAQATVAVDGFTGVYDGAAHGATGTATGVNGEDLSALLDLGASFTNVPGGAAEWSFAGNTNYQGASGDVGITITQAEAAIVVNGFTGVYDGAAHGATGTATGVNGEDLSSLLDLGASFTDVAGGTAEWSFAGNTNYAPAGGTAAITITQAEAAVLVNGFTGVYDGAAHGATGTATGVNGEDLSALLDLGASFTNVPGGTAEWSFAGNTNYA